MSFAFAFVSVCVAQFAIGSNPAPAATTSAVDMVVSVSDGGSPFVAQPKAGLTSPPSGAWAVTVRNTGTAASSGTTKVELEQAVVTGYVQHASGSGWTCSHTGSYATCTNPAVVPAGGSLPPLSFPFAALPGYGYARAQAILTNPSDGTLNNDTLSIDTPVVEQVAVNLSMSLGDGGSPFVAQPKAGLTSPPSGAWAVTVRNTGTAASSGTTKVELEQAVVTGYVQHASGSGWTCSHTGSYATCTNPAVVPAGGSLPPLSFPFAALPGYGYARAQAILTNPSDGTLNNDTLSIDTPVVEQVAVNLSMSLGDGGSPFVAQPKAGLTSPPSGAWAVTVRNTGTAASSGTTKVELEQAVVTGYVQHASGSGWTCSHTGSYATCTNPAVVPAGGSLPPLSFPFAALPGYGYARAQAILTNPSDGTLNNDTLSIDTPVVEQVAVNLSMSLGDGGSPFVAQPKAGLTSPPSGAWAVTVRNTGTAASSGTTKVELEQAVVTGYVQHASGSGWTCSHTGSYATCTNPAVVPAGGSLPPLSFPFAALPGYGYARAQAILTNPSDGTLNNDTLSIDTPVVQPVSTIDVVAMVSDGGSPFTGGSQATATVTVQNVGTSAATGVTTVHYPVPFDGVTASGTGWTCTASTVADPTCTYPGGVAAGSALPPVTVTGTVPAQDAPATVVAGASVDNASDAFTDDNNTSLQTTVTPLPIDVVAMVSDGGSPFTGGSQATATVTVQNVGTSAATGVTTVHYPVPFDGVTASGTGWTCTASTVADPTCTYPGGVAAGSALPPVTVTGTVPAQDAPATVVAGASVDNASDAFTDDNNTSLQTTVTPLPIDVVAMVSDGGSPFTGGSQATATVTVQNVGTSAATGVTTVHYPVPFDGVTASGTGWTCTASTVADPTCTYPGGVAAGSALPPVTVTGTVPAQDAPATVVAGASVDNASDAFTDDNNTSLQTTVTPLPIDVVAMVSDGGFPLSAGKQAVWTVRVQNVGTSAATGITTVHYPTPLGGEVATGKGWTCTASTVPDPTCTRPGGVAPGSALPPVTVTTTVPAQDAPATVVAGASVDNASDAFTDDNNTYLDTAVTSFRPITAIYGSACPDVMVLAARGSGESPTDWTSPAAYINDSYRGTGQVNWDVYQRLLTARPDLHISLDPIMYPADPVNDFIDGNIPTYFASVASGAQTIVYDMQLTDFKCGGTVRYILTGYSQGAWAVHDALWQIARANPSELARIAGVALFGDSDFVNSQPIVRDYYSADIADGASAGVDSANVGVPAQITAHSGSWCYPTDPVCQFTPDNIATYGPFCLIPGSSGCPHFQYVSGGETQKAAPFLVPFLPTATLFPHLTLTPPPTGTVGQPYTWTATASCGTSCTWSAKTSGLPPGLTFSKTGILAGTPTQPGTYTFYITATAAYGRGVSGNVTITVNT